MKKLQKILVVDGSRVVRALLSRHLQGEFEIIEEADGESAWQTLMLDARVAAVISGRHTPRLEAQELLVRLRASAMRRLRTIPFVLLLADTDDADQREADRAAGVAGFIAKSMSQSAIVDYLNELLTGTPASAMTGAASIPGQAAAPKPTIVDSDKVLANDQFNEVLAAISLTRPTAEPVCALVFAIDNHDQLTASFGEGVAEVIAERFASLLLAKVGPQDSIGRWHDHRLAIISHGADLKQGVNFAHRVCKSLTTGQISIRGSKTRLTASAGVASNSDDAVENGTELFALAEKRLQQALVGGGNTVATEFKAARPLHTGESIAAAVREALATHGDASPGAGIGALGLKILPLLQIIDSELALDLPLERIEQQLQERARQERTPG